ncbi:LmeA family phospholipid-binding protein [Tomitella biformata]|uniref:LmeA family phospholipid-binding protein n=1 Tax=Tomitella biformata TaxID=630403 RepID=UPI000463611B|nr:LmeA family phospholipid-binding protein [Tomitella biformata]
MLDPFDIGWQRHIRGLERIVDTGVGLGWGIGKALLYSEVGTSLTRPLALASSVPLTPAQVLQSVMSSIAEQFLDKRISMAVTNDTATVSMTPKTLVTDVNSLGLARGQFASIKMTAADLVWQSGSRTINVDHLSVDCHDIRLRTSLTPALVFGTIDVGVTVSARELRALILEQQPDLTVDIGPDGVLRASWSRLQRLGHVVVEAEVDEDGNIALTPSSLHIASLTVGLRRWFKRQVIEVPPLPWKMRLVGLETDGGQLRLRGLSEQAEGRISTVPVTELLTLVRAAVRIL